MKKGLSPLRSLWSRLNLESRMQEAKVMAAWEELVGPSIGQQTRPTGIKDGMLWVAATSPAWVHQLTMMRLEILKKIQARFGPKLVTDIRFHSGARNPLERPERAAPRQAAAERLRLPELDDREMGLIEERVNVIGDPELRQRTRDLLMKASRRQKALQKKGYKRCATCGTLQPDTGCLRCPLIGT